MKGKSSWKSKVPYSTMCRYGRCFVFTFCAICFAFNTCKLFERFSKGTTTIASFTVWTPDGIDPPAMMFCDSIAVKRDLNNQSLAESLGVLTSSSTQKRAKYELKPLRTLLRGTCYVLDIKEKVLSPYLILRIFSRIIYNNIF